MKSSAIIVIAALTFIVGADKPKSPSAVKAQRTYEDAVRAADNQQRESLTTAQEEYLKQLKEASDAALTAKDLNAANEIEAARKAIAKKKPFTSPTFQLAIESQRNHEDSVQVANEHHLDAVKKAEEVYLKDLQGWARRRDCRKRPDGSEPNRCRHEGTAATDRCPGCHGISFFLEHDEFHWHDVCRDPGWRVHDGKPKVGTWTPRR